MNIQPFEVHISDTTLQDLQERLEHTRWPDEILETGWDYGTNMDYLKDLVSYWRTQFDWRAQEDMINRFSNFKTYIDGLGIHFIHEHGKGPDPLPIIITHGWPSSFLEMLKVIPLLTDPESHGGKAEDSFDVIVPSLPGYGFSDRPRDRGMAASRTANIWASLMNKELGYRRFAAQGGDIGSIVTEQLAVDYPDLLIGIHLDTVPFQHLFQRADNLSEAEKNYMQEVNLWQLREGAYMMIQSTKPQTLSYALNDSPVGLAAWIVEKFRSWSDCSGNTESRFTKDELLTNITLYWVTETMNSANRFYYEAGQEYMAATSPRRSDVQTALAIFPKDICPSPREWAERWFNVKRWTKMPSGGHFAATEEPELLVEDIVSFLRPLRPTGK